MELKEIEGLFLMDYGAPSPTIISNDRDLFVAFYVDKEATSEMPQQRNSISDTGVISIKFKWCQKYTFGSPSNETLHGHPYYKLGLRSCAFYELKDSDLIKSLQEIEKSHDYYSLDGWEKYKHYILTFHDNMFECVALDFEIREEETSLYNHMSSILNELSW